MAERAVAIAARWLATGEGERVRTALTPEDVAARFDEALPREGKPADDVLRRFEEDYVSVATRLIHRRYVGHQVAPPLPEAGAADLVASVMNNGMAVWEMSPGATVIEHRVLAWFAGLVGWDAGYGGTFVSGGAVGNLTGLAAARARAFPDAWEEGMDGRRGCVVAAASAHYCVERAAGLLGLGRRGVVSVDAGDAEGRLDPERAAAALDRARDEGRTVVALVATAGSTPTAAVDDLEALADVCAERGVWFHVDAAHAGAFLLSERLRPMLAGLERADSFALDLHKMMFQPISTALVLVRERARLAAAFDQSAPYIFHERAEGPSWDQGPLALQCSRRADALRVWLSLQLRGADGIAALQERTVATARAAAQAIAARPEFEVPHEPQTNILCFRHVPARFAGDARALDEHNAVLRERLNASGTGFLTGTVLDGRRVLRMTFMHAGTGVEHVEEILDALERLVGE